MGKKKQLNSLQLEVSLLHKKLDKQQDQIDYAFSQLEERGTLLDDLDSFLDSLELTHEKQRQADSLRKRIKVAIF